MCGITRQRIENDFFFHLVLFYYRLRKERETQGTSKRWDMAGIYCNSRIVYKKYWLEEFLVILTYVYKRKM